MTREASATEVHAARIHNTVKCWAWKRQLSVSVLTTGPSALVVFDGKFMSSRGLYGRSGIWNREKFDGGVWRLHWFLGLTNLT